MPRARELGGSSVDRGTFRKDLRQRSDRLSLNIDHPGKNLTLDKIRGKSSR
jgi:hypothetical protein